MINKIANELMLIFLAHERVGLDGKMCLYSVESGTPFPAKTKGMKFWFGKNEVEQAVEFFRTNYNDGRLPNTTLLLNPIVHRQINENEYEPLGSGVFWVNALSVSTTSPDKIERMRSIPAAAAYVVRDENKQAGLKIVAFSDAKIPAEKDGSVKGNSAFYNVSDIKSEEYKDFYLLCGIPYLSNTGAYIQPTFTNLFGQKNEDEKISDADLKKILDAYTVSSKTIEEAAKCWEAYDHNPALYKRFGNNVSKLDENLKFYYLCARDFELFDVTGPINYSDKVESFEFLVHGMIPRGAIVLLAGTGGTGKSSLAHRLCTLVATDWRDDEKPMWIGQEVNKKLSKGIVVYFSGEDGPAILKARNELFDPEGRAHRLQFHKAEFNSSTGDKVNFPQFLERLKKMPDVPLLVVDPARKYLTGDEDDSEVVSEFFEALEKFSHEKNTAVIVVHHLSKGAHPKSARDVLDELRGSQVFIDRPRVVIGMYRDGPYTVVGLGKCNIPHNLGMQTDERVFSHNPKTLDLIQLPGEAGVRNKYHVTEEGS